MRVELPELKRCCFCLPLRRGLLFWVYLKLVIALLLLLFIIVAPVTSSSSKGPDLFRYFVITIAIIILLMDIALCILFLISAHRKNHENMRVYYKYAIGVLIFVVITMSGIAGVDIYRLVFLIIRDPDDMINVFIYMASFSFMFIEIVLQAYFLILVRSELLKLERTAKIEFINHTNEPDC